MEPEIPDIQELLLNLTLKNADILAHVRQWVDCVDDAGRKKLLSSSSARDALTTRLQQACDACAAVLEVGQDPGSEQLLLQHLMSIDVLVGIIPQEPGHQLARLLLYGCNLLKALASVLSCICELTQQFEVVTNVSDEVLHAGRAVCSVILDMAQYTYPVKLAHLPSQHAGGSQASAVGQATGRDALGPALLEPLLALIITTPQRSNAVYYSLRRSGVSLLRELVTRCRRNQQLLLGDGLADSYRALMSEVLPSCGDQPTQVEALEVMYRCAKPVGERAYHQHLNAQMRGLFAQLLAKEASDLDLETELQVLAEQYNTSLGSRARWVADLLLYISPSHLSMGVQLDDPEEEGVYDEEQLDIDLANIAGVIVTEATAAQHAKAAGCFMVDVQCRDFPPSLGPDVAAAAEAAAAARAARHHGESNSRAVPLGNLPASYLRPHKEPLSMVKSTPSTSNKPIRPLQLFKSTPQSTPTSSDAAVTNTAAAAANAEATNRAHRTKSRLSNADKNGAAASLSAMTPPGRAVTTQTHAQQQLQAAVSAGGTSAAVTAEEDSAAAVPLLSSAAADRGERQGSHLHPTAQLVASDDAGAAAGGSGSADATTGPRSDSQVLALLDNIMTDTEQKLATGHRGNRSSLDSEEAAAQLAAAAGAAGVMALPRAAYAAKAGFEAAAARVTGVQEAEGKQTAAAQGLRLQGPAAAAACNSGPCNAGSDQHRQQQMMKEQRKGVGGKGQGGDSAAAGRGSGGLQVAGSDSAEGGLYASAPKRQQQEGSKHHQAPGRTGTAAATADRGQHVIHAAPGAAEPNAHQPSAAAGTSKRALAKPPSGAKTKHDIKPQKEVVAGQMKTYAGKASKRVQARGAVSDAFPSSDQELSAEDTEADHEEGQQGDAGDAGETSLPSRAPVTDVQVARGAATRGAAATAAAGAAGKPDRKACPKQAGMDDATTAATGKPGKAAVADSKACHQGKTPQPSCPFEYEPASSPAKAAKAPKAAAEDRKPLKAAAAVASKKAKGKGQAATATTRARAPSAAGVAGNGAGTAVRSVKVTGSKRKATTDSEHTKQQQQRHIAKNKAAMAGARGMPAESPLCEKQHATSDTDDEGAASDGKDSGLAPEDVSLPAAAPEADQQQDLAAQQPTAKLAMQAMHKQLQGMQSEQQSPDQVPRASEIASHKGLRLELPTRAGVGSVLPVAGHLQLALPDEQQHGPALTGVASAAASHEGLDGGNENDGLCDAAEQQHHYAGSDGEDGLNSPGGLGELVQTPGAVTTAGGDDGGGGGGGAAAAMDSSPDSDLADLTRLAAAAAAARGVDHFEDGNEADHDLGSTPENLKIHTDKIRRQLALTGAAQSGLPGAAPKIKSHRLLPLPVTTNPATLLGSTTAGRFPPGGLAGQLLAGPGAANLKLKQAAPLTVTDIAMLAQLVAQSLRDPDDDDQGAQGDDSDSDEVELLHAALVAALTKKRAAAKHKQQAIIKELEQAILSKLADLETSLHSDMDQLQAAGRTRLAALTTALQDKAANIAAMKVTFDDQLAAAWREYSNMYGQLDVLQEELRLRAEKRRSSYKRKLSALQQDAAAMIAQAEQRLPKRRSPLTGAEGRAGINLASLLQAMTTA
eukprot:gene4040-4287_t